MTSCSEKVEIQVEEEVIAGTMVSPRTKVPGILFVHGWGGSQERDLARAKGIAGLGCVCLTFDLRGHELTRDRKQSVTREQNLTDILAAYDRLASHPATDIESIAVIGTSYGGYLSAILSTLRPVKWLALRVPALYWDEEWDAPKDSLDRQRLAEYRHTFVPPQGNRALSACSEFEGDVLLVESEHDDFVPHTTLMSYRAAFIKAHSLTHRIVDGADHSLSSDSAQRAYTTVLTTWISEMVIGARIGDYPHHLAIYS
ncbi:alpha/beta hydrolase family protein [Pseudomonas subflava]|uniref:alpha/beta hydrolase family protein n=1 Tax=Pseudomonas subflava TaxID=2952933 RepID=UPI002079AC55|nr:alpha/beta fold hydrolase [Pseudomonas subflava]